MEASESGALRDVERHPLGAAVIWVMEAWPIITTMLIGASAISTFRYFREFGLYSIFVLSLEDYIAIVFAGLGLFVLLLAIVLGALYLFALPAALVAAPCYYGVVALIQRIRPKRAKATERVDYRRLVRFVMRIAIVIVTALAGLMLIIGANTVPKNDFDYALPYAAGMIVLINICILLLGLRSPLAHRLGLWGLLATACLTTGVGADFFLHHEYRSEGYLASFASEDASGKKICGGEAVKLLWSGGKATVLRCESQKEIEVINDPHNLVLTFDDPSMTSAPAAKPVAAK